MQLLKNGIITLKDWGYNTMNQKEYELIARVFKNRKPYPSNGTARVFGKTYETFWFVLVGEMAYQLEREYKNFDRTKFYKVINLTVEEMNRIELT